MTTIQKTLAQDKQVIVEVRFRINNIYNLKKYPYKNITVNVTMHKELDSTFVVVSIVTLYVTVK